MIYIFMLYFDIQLQDAKRTMIAAVRTCVSNAIVYQRARLPWPLAARTPYVTASIIRLFASVHQVLVAIRGSPASCQDAGLIPIVLPIRLVLTIAVKIPVYRIHALTIWTAMFIITLWNVRVHLVTSATLSQAVLKVKERSISALLKLIYAHNQFFSFNFSLDFFLQLRKSAKQTMSVLPKLHASTDSALIRVLRSHRAVLTPNAKFWIPAQSGP